MFKAITYQNMLKNIESEQVTEDTIGILITRPDLEVGKSILNERSNPLAMLGRIV